MAAVIEEIAPNDAGALWNYISDAMNKKYSGTGESAEKNVDVVFMDTNCLWLGSATPNTFYHG